MKAKKNMKYFNEIFEIKFLKQKCNLHEMLSPLVSLIMGQQHHVVCDVYSLNRLISKNIQ